MTRWTLGPKFSAYLGLNFELMRGTYTWYFLYCLLYGAVYAKANYADYLSFLWLFLAASLALLTRWAPDLMKETITDHSAMFYVSIPVTSFETVLAKMVSVALGAWIPLIALGNLFLIAFYFSEEKWRSFVTQMWNLGFTRQNLLPGLLLIIWGLAVLGLVLGGISLLAWFLGNRLGSGKKWTTWILYIFLELVLLAAAAGLLWLIWLASVLPVLVRLLLMMAAAVVLSVVLVRLNVAVLEKWYAI